MPPDRPQRVTLPTLQILAAFMSDLSRDDWYGRALSVHTGLGSGTVLQCLYRLENWGWLESRYDSRHGPHAPPYCLRVRALPGAVPWRAELPGPPTPGWRAASRRRTRERGRGDP